MANRMPHPSLGRVALRCLIVDDNAGFLEAARVLLEQEGIRVVGVARTGDEALRAVADLRPDVTLLDVDLGGESGFEVARRLAHHGGPVAAPVILISVHSEDDLAELIDGSPAIGFVGKSSLSAAMIKGVLEAAGPAS
jgi:DNA-binding NarL/FixJ family response regulator